MGSISEARQLWRLVKTDYAATAFDGEGAFRYGGRWNSRGQRVVYASGSLSLALLEVLVHLDPAAKLPSLCAFRIALSTDAIEVDHFSRLETIANELPWSLRQTRAWGDAWRRRPNKAVLQIPSALVPYESNYLIAPREPGFAQLMIGKPEAFSIAPRLF
jgi:RES domain-containing protein